LAERFQLSMHTETREIAIYRMVLRNGKTGPNLKPSSCIPGANSQDPKGQSCLNHEGRGLVAIAGGTMDTLANRLGRLPQIARPVVNETGMNGTFDFELTFEPDPAANDSAAVSIFTALQEQLGVRLEGSRGAVEVLVIDKAQPPSEN